MKRTCVLGRLSQVVLFVVRCRDVDGARQGGEKGMGKQNLRDREKQGFSVKKRAGRYILGYQAPPVNSVLLKTVVRFVFAFQYLAQHASYLTEGFKSVEHFSIRSTDKTARQV